MYSEPQEVNEVAGPAFSTSSSALSPVPGFHQSPVDHGPVETGEKGVNLRGRWKRTPWKLPKCQPRSSGLTAKRSEGGEGKLPEQMG